MGLIVLVRHGQASWGAADYDELSQLGHHQAALAGAQLASTGVVPDRVIRGSLKRHEQSAVAACAAAGLDQLDQVVDSRWDEFDHLDVFSHAEHGEENPRWFDGALRRWVGGEHDDYTESYRAFAERVSLALDDLGASLRRGEVVVVFTSGGPISAIAVRLLHAPSASWTTLNPVIANASFSRVVVGSRGTTLISLNEQAHLLGENLTYR